jgi:hypothetical protein
MELLLPLNVDCVGMMTTGASLRDQKNGVKLGAILQIVSKKNIVLLFHLKHI